MPHISISILLFLSCVQRRNTNFDTINQHYYMLPFHLFAYASSMPRLQKSEALNILNDFSQKLHKERRTHTPVNTTNTRFSDCLATHMYIYYSTKSLILLCFFPFSFSLNPYERNARRTSTPQERRQRAQHCHRTLINAISAPIR